MPGADRPTTELPLSDVGSRWVKAVAARAHLSGKPGSATLMDALGLGDGAVVELVRLVAAQLPPERRPAATRDLLDGSALPRDAIVWCACGRAVLTGDEALCTACAPAVPRRTLTDQRRVTFLREVAAGQVSRAVRDGGRGCWRHTPSGGAREHAVLRAIRAGMVNVDGSRITLTSSGRRELAAWDDAGRVGSDGC